MTQPALMPTIRRFLAPYAERDLAPVARDAKRVLKRIPAWSYLAAS